MINSLPKIVGRVRRLYAVTRQKLGNGLVTFPVEESAWSLPDLRLIARSAHELLGLADREGWARVVVPRPGCGGGGLQWQEVRSILEEYFDDRFLIVDRTF